MMGVDPSNHERTNDGKLYAEGVWVRHVMYAQRFGDKFYYYRSADGVQIHNYRLSSGDVLLKDISKYLSVAFVNLAKPWPIFHGNIKAFTVFRKCI